MSGDLLGALAPVAGEVIEAEVDRLGGGAKVLETAVYDMTVDKAFITKSAGGATALNVWLKGTNGEELKEQFYMTSGTAKGGKNWYMAKDGKTKNYLPGYNNANALCLLTLGVHIHTLSAQIESKIVPIYDFNEKKEVSTAVDMLMPIIGKRASFGVVKQLVDKNVKDASGAYVPSGETREQNEINKIFRIDNKLTVQEITKGVTEPVFYNTWVTKMTGTVVDKTSKTGAVAGSAAVQAAPVANIFAAV